MPVYFVQAGDGGQIKIGFARDVSSRLVKMRVDCPIPLTLLAAIEGDAKFERDLQERFAAHSTRGEWFAPAPDLLAFIATLPKPAVPRRKIKSGDHPLRQYRCDRGLTLGDIARMVGVSHATISRIEDRRLRPNLALVIRLSEATGGAVSIEQIVRCGANTKTERSTTDGEVTADAMISATPRRASPCEAA